MVLGHTQSVLVIDDEIEVLTQISTVLEEVGYQCRVAQDARAAEELLKQGTPDLLIVDVNLAGHSGITLCEHLRQQPELALVPVMFLSAAQGPDIIRRRTRPASCTSYYVRKPFDAEVLLQLVEKALRVTQMA